MSFTAVYIALLRGINVGGHRRIAMPDLQSLCESIGWHQATTYIQSGNVVFCSTPEQAQANLLEQAIQQRYGFEVRVLLRSTPQWQAVIDRNPFAHENITDNKLLHVIAIDRPAPNELVAALDPNTYAPDRWVIDQQHIYLYCPNGYGRTQLSNDFWERKLRLQATTRNYNTVLRLMEIARTQHLAKDPTDNTHV